jgi:hypothetical protein
MSGLKNIVLIPMLFVTVILSESCKRSIKTRAELITYIDDPKNGLKVTNDIGKVEATMNYKPWQLMAINHQKSKGPANAPGQNNFSGKYYFVLSLSANHKELLRQLQFSDYSEMVQVLAFRMMEYVIAVPDNGKAVAPEDCLFQQTYGMSTSNQLLIVFDKSKLNNTKEIDIKIKEFGLNIGNLNYRFKLKDINDIQNIALNN